jgi:CheY-like chemotaxis protein
MVMPGKALIVDDDESVRFVLRQALADTGWTLGEVDDGTAVEAELAKHRFDLLVLDIYMSGMNGYEVLRRLRRNPLKASGWKTRADVPVLVISGEAENEGLAFAKRIGANAALKKPFDVVDVQRTARELVAQAPGAASGPPKTPATKTAGRGGGPRRLRAQSPQRV